MEKNEMVDIVDDKGNILYSVSKNEAHTKGLLHFTVISEIRNTKGEWLLVRQASDRQDAGQYVSPVGGHVRTGETLVNALIREAGEEVGMKGFKYEYIGKAVFNREVIGRKENHFFVLYEIYCDDVPRLNNESVSYKWYTTDALVQDLKEKPEKFGNAFHFVVRNFFPNLQK